MDSETQAVMFADVHLWKPRPSAEPEPSPGPRPAPRLEAINRNQLILRPVDVDQLIPPDHPARAIWELVGQCDLSRFYEKIQAVEGVAGRPPRPPQLLISLLIYGYQEGIPSCREIAERSQYHPAYQWLTGAKPICAHILSDFRSKQGEGLRELMAQVLALLASEGMVDLEQVTQDGTKVRASAGSDTFRRKATLQRLLEQARERVKQLESEDSEEVSLRSLRARLLQQPLQRGFPSKGVAAGRGSYFRPVLRYLLQVHHPFAGQQGQHLRHQLSQSFPLLTAEVGQDVGTDRFGSRQPLVSRVVLAPLGDLATGRNAFLIAVDQQTDQQLRGPRRTPGHSFHRLDLLVEAA